MKAVNSYVCSVLGCPYNCQECLNYRECQRCKTGLSKLVRDARVYCVWHCPRGYLAQEDNNEEKTCVKGKNGFNFYFNREVRSY